MPLELKHEPLADADEAALQQDPHWQLVERILASSGFERATQLRNLLHYISRKAILEPAAIIREYEIACDVLGRRADFDPSRDNIARAQVSHLRRKLEAYFSNEGKDEPVVLTIQKGSYTPVFKAARVEPQEPAVPPRVDEALAFAQPMVPEDSGPAKQSGRRPWLIATCCLVLLLCSVVAFLVGKSYSKERGPQVEASQENAFVRFLTNMRGDVTIVTPDLSLVLVRHLGNTDISIAEYKSTQYPAQQLASVTDPVLHTKLQQVAAIRNTTMEEALIGFDFKDVLQRNGVRSLIRFSRDLHVQDFSQGNSVLIGGAGSDIWTSLFTDRLNFQYREEGDDVHFVQNLKPQPGEQSKYIVKYPTEGSRSIGYADIALTQNPTHSGYVLIINGTDSQASEAATSFLLHGQLPAEIVALLSTKDISYFEILLRGTHVGYEAEDSVEVVATRR